jgi:hypothetical protein
MIIIPVPVAQPDFEAIARLPEPWPAIVVGLYGLAMIVALACAIYLLVRVLTDK